MVNVNKTYKKEYITGISAGRKIFEIPYRLYVKLL
jgi:hypothetical protein